MSRKKRQEQKKDWGKKRFELCHNPLSIARIVLDAYKDQGLGGEIRHMSFTIKGNNVEVKVAVVKDREYYPGIIAQFSLTEESCQLVGGVSWRGLAGILNHIGKKRISKAA